MKKERKTSSSVVYGSSSVCYNKTKRLSVVKQLYCPFNQSFKK
jgi:hypothetical protein